MKPAYFVAVLGISIATTAYSQDIQSPPGYSTVKQLSYDRLNQIGVGDKCKIVGIVTMHTAYSDSPYYLVFTGTSDSDNLNAKDPMVVMDPGFQMDGAQERLIFWGTFLGYEHVQYLDSNINQQEGDLPKIAAEYYYKDAYNHNYDIKDDVPVGFENVKAVGEILGDGPFDYRSFQLGKKAVGTKVAVFASLSEVEKNAAGKYVQSMFTQKFDSLLKSYVAGQILVVTSKDYIDVPEDQIVVVYLEYAGLVKAKNPLGETITVPAFKGAGYRDMRPETYSLHTLK